MLQAPSNAVALWSVPPVLRPFGMAMLIICIHLLGDVPSPPELGWLQNKVDNWRSEPLQTVKYLFSAVCLFKAR